jgi:hypothetical protein
MRMKMSTTQRTSADVQHDLAAWRREMDIAMAQVNLASARMRCDAPGTVAFAEAAAEQKAAFARMGQLDRRREDLQTEARTFYPRSTR